MDRGLSRQMLEPRYHAAPHDRRKTSGRPPAFGGFGEAESGATVRPYSVNVNVAWRRATMTGDMPAHMCCRLKGSLQRFGEFL
jgi:hypothetical protein